MKIAAGRHPAGSVFSLLSIVLVAVGLGFVAPAAASNVNWNQFRYSPAKTGLNPNEHTLNSNNVGGLTKLWSANTKSDVNSSASVVAGVVYVGSSDGGMHAYDAASGKHLWSFQTGGEVLTSPAVTGGVVYFGSDDDNV